MSAFLVGMMLVMSLELVGASTRGKVSNGEQARARQLAQDLLDEISALPYKDPDNPGFGPESGEAGSNRSNRSKFDDIDDYLGYSELSPTHKDGTPFSEMSDWGRFVVVRRVQPNNLWHYSHSESGVRQVIVYVRKGQGRMVYVAVGIFSKHWERE